MNQARYEIHLRPTNPAEQPLLSAIKDRGSHYGGISDLARECLLHGYQTLRDRLDAIPAPDDLKAVTLALASVTSESDAFGYRFICAFIRASRQSRHEHQGALGRDAEDAAIAASDREKVGGKDKARLNTKVAFADTAVADEPAGALKPLIEVTSPEVASSYPAKPVDGKPLPRPAAPSTVVDWSTMKGLAGIK